MGTLQSGVISQAVLLTENSLTERLKTVSVNTLIGLCIAFAVFVLIILFLLFFKIIPSLQNNNSPKGSNKNKYVDNVFAQIVEQEEQLMENHELVAVITAAIYASMQDAVPADGFVVRSIRKVNSKRKY